MLNPETELYIYRLSDGLRSSFERIAQRDRKELIDDLAEAWADYTAGILDDIRLIAPPQVDPKEPLLPFFAPHRIRAELFQVHRSGMRGGPRLDLIVQIWLDTEDMHGGFGVPLWLCRVPSWGRMPRPVWSELGEAARQLGLATPAGRIALFGDGADFDWGQPGMTFGVPVVVANAHSFAALQAPPFPKSGLCYYHFCNDLASGWIGDPALSGRAKSPVLDEILRTFHVGYILRIRIARDADC